MTFLMAVFEAGVYLEDSRMKVCNSSTFYRTCHSTRFVGLLTEKDWYCCVNGIWIMGCGGVVFVSLSKNIKIVQR